MLSIIAAVMLSQAQPVVEVSASKLVQAYNKNEIGADTKFKGKSLRVEGAIFVVGKNASGGFFIALHDPRQAYWVVQCQLKSNDPRVGDLENGAQLKVTGKGSGLKRGEFNQIFLTDCTF